MFLETRDEGLRNELVLHYQYIARSVAMQMRGIFSRYAQIEDIVNQGILTLIDCVERFDPEKQAKFETYAYLRVKGAVVDFVRKQDWVPRRVRKTAKEIAEASQTLANQLMREPTDQELVDFLKITEGELHKNYAEISGAVTFSFEALLENAWQKENSQLVVESEEGQPEERLFDKELKSQLVQALESLNERERLIVSLYYYERLRFNEIAKILEVSESRICQLHTRIMLKLRQKMEFYIKG